MPDEAQLKAALAKLVGPASASLVGYGETKPVAPKPVATKPVAPNPKDEMPWWAKLLSEEPENYTAERELRDLHTGKVIIPHRQPTDQLERDRIAGMKAVPVGQHTAPSEHQLQAGSAPIIHERQLPTEATWNPIIRGMGKLEGVAASLLHPIDTYTKGKKAASDVREELSSPLLPESPAFMGPPPEMTMGERASRFAHNTYEGLGGLMTMVPAEILDTLAPRFGPVYKGKDKLAHEQRQAFAEGEQSGQHIAEGILGGTADVIHHPLESLEANLPQTVAIARPLVGGLSKLAKAGAEKVSPGISERTSIAAEKAIKPVKVRIQSVAKAVDNRLGNIPSKVRAQYIAKFVKGFYAGEPAATAFAEKVARGGEEGDAAMSALAGDITRAYARDMANPEKRRQLESVTVPPEDLTHPMLLEGAPPDEPPLPPGPNIPASAPYPKGHPNEGLLRSEGRAKSHQTINFVHDEALKAPELDLEDPKLDVERSADQLRKLKMERFRQDQAARKAKHEERLVALEARVLNAVGDEAKQKAREARNTQRRGFAADEVVREIAIDDAVDAFKDETRKKRQAIEAKRAAIEARRQRELAAVDARETKDIEAHRARTEAAWDAHMEKVKKLKQKHDEEVLYPYIDQVMEERRTRQAAAEAKKAIEERRMTGEGTVHEEQVGGEPIGFHPDESAESMRNQGASDQYGQSGMTLAEETIGRARRIGTMPQTMEAIGKAAGELSKDASLEDILKHRMENAVGDVGGGMPSTFRAQYASDPFTAAKSYLNAAEQKLERKLTRQEAKGLVGVLERETHVTKEVEGNQIAVRERPIPHLRDKNGRPVELDPHELLGTKTMTPKDELAAVQHGVERTLKEFGGENARKKLIEGETQRPFTSAEEAGGLSPEDSIPYLNAMGKRATAATPESARGSTLPYGFTMGERENHATYAAATAAIVKSGGTIPQVLPTGKNAINPIQLAAALEDVHPNDPAIQAAAKQLRTYKPLDAQLVGHEGYAAPLFKDAIEWHERAEKGMKDVLAKAINSYTKGGLTIHNLPANLTNFMANVSAKILSRGRDPVTYLAGAEKILFDQRLWNSGHKVSQSRARTFQALSEAGVGGNDFMSAEMTSKATPGEKFGAPKGTQWLVGKPASLGGKVMHAPNAIQEWLYQRGDKVFRTEEAVHQLEGGLINKGTFYDLDHLGEGRHYDLYPTANSRIRITKEGGKYFSQDLNALDAVQGRKRPITQALMDKLAAKQAGVRATYLTQDYNDLPQYGKWVKTMPLGWVAPFASWMAAARSLPGIPGIVPGKKGLLWRLLLETPNKVHTNDPAILGRSAVADIGLSMRRAMIINGIKQDIDSEDPHSSLAMAFRRGPEDARKWLIRAVTQPGLMGGINLGGWAALGPDEPLVGGLAAVSTLAEGPQARGMGRNKDLYSATHQPTKFSRAIMDAQTGKDWTADKALDLMHMSGGVFKDFMTYILNTQKPGVVADPAEMADKIMSIAIGGTQAKVVKSIAGTVTEPGGPIGPGDTGYDTAMTLGGKARHRTLHAEDVRQMVPLLNWWMGNLTGKMYETRDFNVNDPKNVHSDLFNAQKEWLASLEVDAKAEGKQKEADALAAGPKAVEQFRKVLYDQSAQDALKNAVEMQIQNYWFDYAKVYLKLMAKGKELEKKANIPIMDQIKHQ